MHLNVSSKALLCWCSKRLLVRSSNLKEVYQKFSEKFEGTANTFKLSVLKGNFQQAPINWKVYYVDGGNIQPGMRGFYVCPVKERYGNKNEMELKLTDIK